MTEQEQIETIEEEWIKETDESEVIHVTMRSPSLNVDDEFAPFVFVGINSEGRAITTCGVDGFDQACMLLAYAFEVFTEQFAEVEDNGEQE